MNGSNIIRHACSFSGDLDIERDKPSRCIRTGQTLGQRASVNNEIVSERLEERIERCNAATLDSFQITRI